MVIERRTLELYIANRKFAESLPTDESSTMDSPFPPYFRISGNPEFRLFLVKDTFRTPVVFIRTTNWQLQLTE